MNSRHVTSNAMLKFRILSQYLGFYNSKKGYLGQLCISLHFFASKKTKLGSLWWKKGGKKGWNHLSMIVTFFWGPKKVRDPSEGELCTVNS